MVAVLIVVNAEVGLCVEIVAVADCDRIELPWHVMMRLVSVLAHVWYSKVLIEA